MTTNNKMQMVLSHGWRPTLFGRISRPILTSDNVGWVLRHMHGPTLSNISTGAAPPI